MTTTRMCNAAVVRFTPSAGGYVTYMTQPADPNGYTIWDQDISEAMQWFGAAGPDYAAARVMANRVVGRYVAGRVEVVCAGCGVTEGTPHMSDGLWPQSLMSQAAEANPSLIHRIRQDRHAAQVRMIESLKAERDAARAETKSEVERLCAVAERAQDARELAEAERDQARAARREAERGWEETSASVRSLRPVAGILGVALAGSLAFVGGLTWRLRAVEQDAEIARHQAAEARQQANEAHAWVSWRQRVGWRETGPAPLPEAPVPDEAPWEVRRDQ